MERISDMLKKIKTGLWSAYFFIFNTLFLATMLAPVVIVGFVVFFRMPGRPYMAALLVSVTAVLMLSVPLCRFLFVRLKFRRRLKRLCKECGFALKLRRSFFVSLFRPSGKVDLTVTTKHTVYAATIIPTLSRFTAVELSPDLSAVRKVTRIGRNSKFTRGMPAGVSRKSFSPLKAEQGSMKLSSHLTERRLRSVIILSPVPGEARLTDDYGQYRVVDNGESAGGRTVYSGGGFVNMLDREARDT